MQKNFLNLLVVTVLLIFTTGCSKSPEQNLSANVLNMEEVKITEEAVEEAPLLTGSVFSSAAKQALPNAQILVNGEIKTQSDKQGKFELVDLQIGDIIRIKKDNYVGISTVVNNIEINLKVELAPIWELSSAAQIYNDVDRADWFEPAIRKLYENQTLTSFKQNSYNPGKKISNAELTFMAVRAAGFLPKETKQSSFCDVELADWFSPAAELALSQKWITGSSTKDCPFGKNFQASEKISRAKAVRIILKSFGDVLAKKIENKKCAELNFEDVDKSAWFFNDIKHALCLGIVPDYANHKFRPNETLTKAEAAVFIANAIEVFEK